MSKRNDEATISKVQTVEAMECVDALRRAAARTEAQRGAAKARRVKEYYVQSRAQHLMTFQQFRSQPVRNKIMKGYGFEPLYLPHEGRPDQSRKPD